MNRFEEFKQTFLADQAAFAAGKTRESNEELNSYKVYNTLSGEERIQALTWGIEEEGHLSPVHAYEILIQDSAENPEMFTEAQLTDFFVNKIPDENKAEAAARLIMFAMQNMSSHQLKEIFLDNAELLSENS